MTIWTVDGVLKSVLRQCQRIGRSAHGEEATDVQQTSARYGHLLYCVRMHLARGLRIREICPLHVVLTLEWAIRLLQYCGRKLHVQATSTSSWIIEVRREYLARRMSVQLFVASCVLAFPVERTNSNDE